VDHRYRRNPRAREEAISVDPRAQTEAGARRISVRWYPIHGYQQDQSSAVPVPSRLSPWIPRPSEQRGARTAPIRTTASYLTQEVISTCCISRGGLIIHWAALGCKPWLDGPFSKTEACRRSLPPPFAPRRLANPGPRSWPDRVLSPIIQSILTARRAARPLGTTCGSRSGPVSRAPGRRRRCPLELRHTSRSRPEPHLRWRHAGSGSIQGRRRSSV
jgi:hypothetical protein